MCGMSRGDGVERRASASEPSQEAFIRREFAWNHRSLLRETVSGWIEFYEDDP